MLCPPLLLLARAWFPLPPLNPPPLAPELGRDDALRLPTWFLAVLPPGRAPAPPGFPAPPTPPVFPAPPTPPAPPGRPAPPAPPGPRPPNLFAVCLFPYGAFPRCCGLCCQLPCPWRLTLRLKLLFLLKLLLLLMLTLPPFQSQLPQLPPQAPHAAATNAIPAPHAKAVPGT